MIMMDVTGFNKDYEKGTIRRLMWFTKKRGKLVGQEDFTDLTLLELRKIFNITYPFYKDPSEPYEEAYDPYMVYCYDVKKEHLEELQQYFKNKIRLDKYDYEVASFEKK